MAGSQASRVLGASVSGWARPFNPRFPGRTPASNMVTTALTLVRTEADLTLPGMTTGSADHLGRLEEEGWRDGQAQGLGGLQVDHQLERHRLLHRQIGGLGPFENLVDVEGPAPQQLGQVRPVG